MKIRDRTGLALDQHGEATVPVDLAFTIPLTLIGLSAGRRRVATVGRRCVGGRRVGHERPVPGNGRAGDGPLCLLRGRLGGSPTYLDGRSLGSLANVPVYGRL